jgi:protein-disulfide isomerase
MFNFQQFPFLDSQSIAKESHQAANASMCAFELGRFWDYHDMLFANQGEVENGGSFNDKRLQAFAESIGLDMNTFDDCFSAINPA